MAAVKIYTLGEFKIFAGEIDVTDIMKSSPKKLLLLQYLIINKSEPLPIDKLVELLWSQPGEIGHKNTLKTLVSRLRVDLEKYSLGDAIITVNGTYAWNDTMNCYVDIYALEEYYTELVNVTTLKKGNRKKFEEVLELYSDDLLSLSNITQYITSNVLYYKDLYISLVSRYVFLLKEDKKYDKIIEVCKKALILNSYNSMLNLELKSALLSKNQSFDTTQKGDSSSEEVLMMYKNLLHREQILEDDIEIIYKELSEYEEEKGAFYCEYSIFKEIYSLHMRNLKRLGSVMFLALITIKPKDSEYAQIEKTNFAMKNLRSILQNNLRSGDTICKYNSTQCASLLPLIDNYEIATMVLERLKEKFDENTANSDFIFEFELIRLDDTTSEEINI